MNRNHWRHPYAAGTKAAALLAMAIGIAIGGGHGNAAASNTPKLSERTPAAGIDEMAEAGPQHFNRPRIAVIIDDFGNGLRGTEEIFGLPIKLTVAVMPFLSTSEADARRAHERGFDILVHLPMEPRNGKPQWLGPGAVLSGLSDQEIRKRVEAAVDQVPYAIGINNHMGSKVTGDERVMGIVLSVCKERGLFFVDSHTNYRSVAGRMAEQMGLPRVENHVFLDDTHTAGHVTRQLRLAGKWALDHNYCVTIGHVGIQGKETAAGIRGGINDLKNRVQFVGISDLVKQEWKWSPRPTFP